MEVCSILTIICALLLEIYAGSGCIKDETYDISLVTNEYCNQGHPGQACPVGCRHDYPSGKQSRAIQIESNDDLCNKFCDNTFETENCQGHFDKHMTGACICRGDHMHNGSYWGGCRYYRGNTNGSQYDCERECNRAEYRKSAYFKFSIAGIVKISDTDACKYGCRIRGCMIKNATSSGFYTRTEPYNLNINSPSTCHEKCESNKGCHYYAYSAENKKCILMNSKATKNIVYEPGTDFWQKDCVLEGDDIHTDDSNIETSSSTYEVDDEVQVSTDVEEADGKMVD